MSFIKFPSAIKPARVTAQLIRSDELFQSPVTGIQQTASRGNAYWQHTIEYRDLSDSERDIVQAFLMNCRGSLSTFKLPDFGFYTIPGDISTTFADVFSHRGHVWTSAGSTSTKLNSYFTKSIAFDHYITDDNEVGVIIHGDTSRVNIRWFDPFNNIAQTMHPGGAYLIRIKQFYPSHIGSGYEPSRLGFRVGPAGTPYFDLYGAGKGITRSEGTYSSPFVVNSTTLNDANFSMGCVEWNPRNGEQVKYADHFVARCALVSNSENLFLESNNFADAAWTNNRTTPESGSGAAPWRQSESNRAWWLNCDSWENATHYISQTVTKNMTEGLWTASIYAKAGTLNELQIRLDAGNTNNGRVNALFWLASGTTQFNAVVDSWSRGHPFMYPVGSDWYKCGLRALCTSESSIRVLYYISSGNGTLFSSVGSDNIETFGAQLREFPFMGQYQPTSDTAIVGTGWQTGSKLIVEGMDPGAKIAAGTRCEIINQYHAQIVNLERSEFKRVTETVYVGSEGHAVLSIDPPIRNAPKSDLRTIKSSNHLGETLHNAVLFSNPEIKSRLVGNTVQYIEKPLRLTDIVFDVIEDLTE